MRLKVNMMGAVSVGWILGLAGAQASWTSINFASLPGSTIQFHGGADSFSINPVNFASGPFKKYNGDQWHVTSESTSTMVGNTVVTTTPYAGPTLNALGSLSGAFGNTWSYTTPISNPGNGIQQTSITTANPVTLLITDTQGNKFTGVINNWGTLRSYQGNGSINAELSQNVTALSYTPGPGLGNTDFQNFQSWGLPSPSLQAPRSPACLAALP